MKKSLFFYSKVTVFYFKLKLATCEANVSEAHLEIFRMKRNRQMSGPNFRIIFVILTWGSKPFNSPPPHYNFFFVTKGVIFDC